MSVCVMHVYFHEKNKLNIIPFIFGRTCIEYIQQNLPVFFYSSSIFCCRYKIDDFFLVHRIHRTYYAQVHQKISMDSLMDLNEVVDSHYNNSHCLQRRTIKMTTKKMMEKRGQSPLKTHRNANK